MRIYKKPGQKETMVFILNFLKAMSEKQTLYLIKVMAFFKFFYILFTSPALCTASKDVRGKLNK